MKGCVKEKTALFLVLIFQLAALGGAQSSCAALCHARRRAGCAQPGALAQAAGHQEAILRVRCSPRTALGSADSDPAKFESKMLKPYGAWEAGKRSLFLQSQTPWLETATEGCAWPHPSCRRLPHQAKHRRVCTVSRGRRLTPWTRAAWAGDAPKSGEAVASPAKPTEAHSCGSIPHSRLVWPIPSSHFKSYALSPSITRCPCSLRFCWTECTLYK